LALTIDGLFGITAYLGGAVDPDNKDDLGIAPTEAPRRQSNA
jgi:hypothetical protein